MKQSASRRNAYINGGDGGHLRRRRSGGELMVSHLRSMQRGARSDVMLIRSHLAHGHFLEEAPSARLVLLRTWTWGQGMVHRIGTFLRESDTVAWERRYRLDIGLLFRRTVPDAAVHSPPGPTAGSRRHGTSSHSKTREPARDRLILSGAADVQQIGAGRRRNIFGEGGSLRR